MPGSDGPTPQASALRQRVIRLVGARLAIGLGLAAAAVAMTAQFLWLDALPETPANDLAMHTAMVDGFLDALSSGQWLPRLLGAPGHVPDIPVFQYYGFVTGLVGLPGVLVGLPAFQALMIGLLGLRMLGLFGVYATDRLLGGGRPVAFLAALVYGFTPYLLSNLYGRIDVAESLAHCELPFLALGLVLAVSRSVPAGAVVIAGTIVCLALTHPIFLLYGAFGLGLMVLVCGSRRGWVAAVAGGVTGLLLSAFQWYPAMLSDDLLSGHFLKYSPFHAAALTSASGLYGPPLSMADRGWTTAEAPFVFHTPGWLTLPVLVALTVLLSRRSPSGRARWLRVMLISGAVFLFLAYCPVDVFQFLPQQTWALQMPYRLLAFSALFTALALPLVRPRLGPVAAAVLLAVTVAQSAPVLLHPTYRTPLAVPASTYASTDYLIRDRSGLTTPDGWLVYHAVPLYPPPPSRESRPGAAPDDDGSGVGTIADSDGWLRHDNRWTVRRVDGLPSRLRIEGWSGFTGSDARLWLAAADRPEWPVSEVRRIAPGRFAASLDLPPGPGPFRLVTDPPSAARRHAAGGVGPGLRLTAIEAGPARVWHRPGTPVPAVLHLVGHTLLADGPTGLWLAAPEAPDRPLTTRIDVGPGAFDVVLPLPDRPGDYVLVPSRFQVPAQRQPESGDPRRLSVRLDRAEVEAVSPAGQPVPSTAIPADAVARTATGAYDRRFVVASPVWPRPDGRLAKAVPVTLPLAFSPFFAITQDGRPLPAAPDRTGRAVVVTADLAGPIDAHYRLPAVCGPAAALGLIFAFWLLFLGVRNLAAKSADPSTSPIWGDPAHGPAQ